MKNQTQTNAIRQILWVFLPLVASILLHSLVLTPIYLTIASNVEWNRTAFPQVIGYFQLLLEYAFYWFLFVFLENSMGKLRVVSYLFPILGLLLFRQGLELLMGYSVMGFPSAEKFFEEELVYLLLQLFFDCALLGLAALLIHFLKQPKRRAFVLSSLPFAFQLISLAVVLFGYRPLTKEILSEAALDLIVHIVCLFAGFGVILFFDRLFGKETENEKTL